MRMARKMTSFWLHVALTASTWNMEAKSTKGILVGLFDDAAAVASSHSMLPDCLTVKGHYIRGITPLRT